MNNALISPNELVYSYDDQLLGKRIAETAQVTFEVAKPLFWIECADDVNAQDWYFQTETQSCQLKPTPPEVLDSEPANVAPETVANVTETVY